MKTPTPMTPFDEATASGLRMLKLFLPLFPPATQSLLAVFIKFIELQNVLQLHLNIVPAYRNLQKGPFSHPKKRVCRTVLFFFPFSMFILIYFF